MIAGIVALISLILFGSPDELLLVHNLDKGVKKFVIEKERKKDILKDIKSFEKSVKEFNKSRKPKFKELKNLYASKSTESQELISFFIELQKDRLEFQGKAVDYRISLYDKIEPDEWTSIVDYSKSIAEKKIIKAKKKDGNKVIFGKTKAKIIESVKDSFRQKLLLDGLDEMVFTIEELTTSIAGINVVENSVLIRKNASKSELTEELVKLNEYRFSSYRQVVLFHSLVKDNTSDEEWDRIIKTFLKELSISSR